MKELDETERALRALTCEWCHLNIPLIKNNKDYHENCEVCTYNPKLLPLFNAGIVGAYAAAASYVKSQRVKLIPDAVQVFDVLAEHILALTPADARQASQEAIEHEVNNALCKAQESFDAEKTAAIASAEARARQAQQSYKADLARDLQQDPEYSLEYLKAAALDSKEALEGAVTNVMGQAIASAEARARILLKGLKKIHNLTGETKTEDYAAGIIADYEAAARTPDSTPKITVTHGGLPGTVSPSASGLIERVNVRNGYADAPPDSTKERDARQAQTQHDEEIRDMAERNVRSAVELALTGEPQFKLDWLSKAIASAEARARQSALNDAADWFESHQRSHEYPSYISATLRQLATAAKLRSF